MSNEFPVEKERLIRSAEQTFHLRLAARLTGVTLTSTIQLGAGH